MDYCKLTDFEIKEQVAKALGIYHGSFAEDGSVFAVVKYGEPKVINVPTIFDPINKVQDAWPFILEHGITMVYMGDHWSVHYLDEFGNEVFDTQDENPLKATCLVFLQVVDYLRDTDE